MKTMRLFPDFRPFLKAVPAVVFLTAAAAQAAAEIPFTILHTNDEHSALLPYPYVDYHPDEPDPTVGGFARLATLLNQFRDEKAEAGEDVAVVSAADILGGAPHFWLIPGGESPEIDLMQRMGYDVVTVGNHEFDYGPEILAQYYRNAGYPEANEKTALVISNLVVPEEHPLAACGFLDTHIQTLPSGLRIGYFGLLGRGASELVALFDPMSIVDLAETSRRTVAALREEGADVVVAVSHSGLSEDQVIAAAVPGINVIVAGHCHTALDQPIRVGETIIVQTGGYLQQLGVLELAYDPESGVVRTRNEETGQPYLVPIDDTIAPDPAIAARIDEYTVKLNRLVAHLTDGAVTDIGQHVLASDFTLYSGPRKKESRLGNFVTDAMRVAVERKLGERVDLAIQGNGVIRSNVRPGTMPHAEGRISFYDLVTAIGLGEGDDGYPGYALTSVYLTGNEVYRLLEISLLLAEVYGDIFFLQVSGARFSYDPERIIRFRVPFAGFPVPSFRAVQSLELYTGDGLQNGDPDAFRPLSRSDRELYHVVLDSYILSYFPRIGEMLPFYKAHPKDRDGVEVVSLKDPVVHTGERELKFWQAVVALALSKPEGDLGIPRLPDHYADTGDRIVETAASTSGLWLLPVALVFVAGVLLRRRYRRSRGMMSG